MTLCNFFWGSHGCDLPAGPHEVHRCIDYMVDENDNASYVPCCEYYEGADAEHRVRFNLETVEGDIEWGEWSYYGEGWRQA